MTSNAQAPEHDVERRYIEVLRAKYEGEGYVFVSNPDTDQLPDFLGTYRPDAVAEKPGQKIAIDVKTRRTSSEHQMRDIRRLFEGHAEWRFRVVVLGSDPSQLALSVAEPATILRRVDEIRTMMAQGHVSPAFVMTWSLLEAALRTRDGQTATRPQPAGTVVQALATNGYIDPDRERMMRALVDLRNRVVHGDLSAEPSTADVEIVLSTIEETLAPTSSAASLQH